MSRTRSIFNSSLGSKYLMALTGIALYLFLIAHLLGNLNIFSGREALNAYAASLRHLPFGFLWVMRIGLLMVFLVHVKTAILLTRANRAARPYEYVFKNTIQASFASRTMPMTGLFVLLFLIYHLLHYTFHIANPTNVGLDQLGRPDVYGMVVNGFSQPAIAGFYIAAMVVLGLHLSHGLASLFQSLGVNHSKYNACIRRMGPILGWAIPLINISIPVSVWLGFVR